MKILYLHDENLETSLGVGNKIRAQETEWKSRGHHVEIRRVRSESESASQSVLKKFLAYMTASARLARQLRPGEFDIVYMRYMSWSPFIFAKLAKAGRIILEINTDDIAERFKSGMLQGMYNLITRRLVLIKAQGIVAVTGELASAAQKWSQWPEAIHRTTLRHCRSPKAELDRHPL